MKLKQHKLNKLQTVYFIVQWPLGEARKGINNNNIPLGQMVLLVLQPVET